MSKKEQELELAAVYARFSSHAQNEQSIEGQLAEAYRYAAAHGYKIIREYVDRAKTGRNDNRAQLQKMLKDTAKKKFTVLILWKVDRIGRNREEIILNKYRCKKNGVRVEYIAESIPNTPEGVILESVLEGFAEYYSLQLAQNVRRGLSESAKKCQATGARCPLGYKVDQKKYVVDPRTAPTVQLIYRLYAEGWTVTEIIKHLNDLGLRTATGKPFGNNSLYTILNNEKYIGVYTYDDQRIEDGMPRIIDDETFEKVQKMLKINKRCPSAKWSKMEYLLTDKLFCGKCGTGMIGESGTSKTGAKHNYYICSKKKHHKTCDKKAVRQDLLEPLVIKKALEILNNDELLEFIIDGVWKYYQAQDDGQEEIEALRKELSGVESAINNLVRAIEVGLLNDATRARMDELTKQKNELIAAIAENEIAQGFQITREHVSFFLYNLRNLDYTARESQKRLIDVFINSIYVFDDHLVLNFNYSDGTHTVSLAETVDGTSGDGFVCHASCSTKH